MVGGTEEEEDEDKEDKEDEEDEDKEVRLRALKGDAMECRC